MLAGYCVDKHWNMMEHVSFSTKAYLHIGPSTKLIGKRNGRPSHACGYQRSCAPCLHNPSWPQGRPSNVWRPSVSMPTAHPTTAHRDTTSAAGPVQSAMPTPTCQGASTSSDHAQLHAKPNLGCGRKPNKRLEIHDRTGKTKVLNKTDIFIDQKLQCITCTV